jgi:hypothetical protein
VIHENSGNNHTYNFFNNIIYNLSSASNGADYAFGSGTGIQTRSISNNLFYGNHHSTEPADPFKLITNPNFVNPGSGSVGINTLNGYQIYTNSPAINSGKLISSNGGYDYFGNVVSSSSVPNRGVYQGAGIATVATLNLKYFLEGYYLGSSIMNTTLNNLEISTDVNAVDTIQVNLWSVANLNNSSPNYTVKAILKKDGTATIIFPAAAIGNSYYIAVRHRNTIETWSASPVDFNASANYDFTTSVSNAYGDGVNPPLKNMANNKFAAYSGDINKDGTIDIFDLQIAENDASEFLFGYNFSDCNGDGTTDIFDLQIIENNAGLFIFYVRP